MGAPLRNDLTLAVRSLKRSPGFVILVVLSLGIALGVTTTMFGLVDTALNPVVPLRQVEQLVDVGNNGDGGAARGASWQETFAAARDGGAAFSGTAIAATRSAFLRLGDHTDWRLVKHVGPDFFALTGIVPFLGRSFASGEADGSRGDGAMVSFALWRKALGGRTDLRGATITVDDRTFDVIGVIPPYLPWSVGATVYLPMRPDVMAGEVAAWVSLYARLKPGATWEGAQEMLRANVDPVLTERFGTGRRPFRFVVRRLADERPDGMTDLQKILLAAGALVLVIAFGNMANLVLARGLVREREFALRFALGAGRASVVRQVLAEALLCTLGGAIIGVIVAHGAFGLLTYHMSREVPGLGAMAVSLNWRIFSFALGLATLTSLAFAFVPAWRTSRVDLNRALKAGAGSTTGRNRSRFSVLVVGEVALTMTLMLGASLLMKAVREMRATEFGYNPRGLLDVSMHLRRGPVGQTPVHSDSMIRALRERLLGTPGVLGASAYGGGPTPGFGITSMFPGGGNHWIFMNGYTAVGHDYVRTMGLAITEGREFVEGDATGRGAVILNETAARVLFRGENAVGQLVKLGEARTNAPIVPVVGVSRDVFGTSTVMPSASAAPELIVVPPSGTVALPRLLVRVSEANLAEAEATVESLVRATLPQSSTVVVMRTLEHFNETILAREFVGRLFVLFALIGCGLAAVGLYCLLAFVVAQRRREFAVRIALGATRREVTKIVVRDGATMVLAGTAIGAFVAMWLARALDAMLYNVFYTDALSLVIAEAVLVLVALAACVVPARRAARSEPVEMLRAA